MKQFIFLALIITLFSLASATPFVTQYKSMGVRGGHKHKKGGECPKWVKMLGLHKEKKDDGKKKEKAEVKKNKK